MKQSVMDGMTSMFHYRGEILIDASSPRTDLNEAIGNQVHSFFRPGPGQVLILGLDRKGLILGGQSRSS